MLLPWWEFRLLCDLVLSSEAVQSSDFTSRQVGGVSQVSVDWKCQSSSGFSSGLFVFSAPSPAASGDEAVLPWCVCDEDLSVGMCFSSHPVPFICSCSRDCLCAPLNSCCYQPSFSLGLSFFCSTLLPASIYLCVFPLWYSFCTFSTFFQVLVKNVCDAAAVGQLRWPWPDPFIHPAHGDIQPCSVAKLAHAQNNPFSSWMLALSFQGLSVWILFCISKGLWRQLQGRVFGGLEEPRFSRCIWNCDVMSPFGNRGLKGKELGLENPFVLCTVTVNLITPAEDARSNYPQACAVERYRQPPSVRKS